MNVVVFDTETVNLQKPFCYNIGYTIVNLDNGETLKDRDFVVEQVWHNPMLFTTAYYADKREGYVSAMRSRNTIMNKYGYICRTMDKDFKELGVENTYAYNSPFDDKVFAYNSDWFHCINPLDNREIFDIRGYVSAYLIDDNYKAFCEENGYFTEAGNYEATAEVVYRYITGNTGFIEDHTALSDSKIEAEILLECIKRGAKPNTVYPVSKFIKREIEKTLTVYDTDGALHKFDYHSIRINKEKTEIKLK